MPCGPFPFFTPSVTVPLSRCRSLYSPGPYQDGFQGPQGPAIFVEKGALFAMSGLSQRCLEDWAGTFHYPHLSEDSEGSKISGLSSYQVVERGLELEIQCPPLILCIY